MYVVQSIHRGKSYHDTQLYIIKHILAIQSKTETKPASVFLKTVRIHQNRSVKKSHLALNIVTLGMFQYIILIMIFNVSENSKTISCIKF